MPNLANSSKQTSNDVWLAFSTTALLSNAETYDSGYIKLVGQTQVQTSVLSDKDGTIVIDFCNDAGDNNQGDTNVDVVRTITIPYVTEDGFQMFAAPAFAQWVRYRFTCNETGQADFLFDTKITRVPLNPQLIGLTGKLVGGMSSLVTRSIAVGEDSAGVYQNVSTISKDSKTSLYTVAGYSNTFTVHLDVAVPATDPVAYMLIDLSDTTNWKHALTGEINLEYMVLEVDPGSTFVGDVKIGYLSSVDATNGVFHTLFDVDMKKSAALLVETIDFGSHGVHCATDHHFGPSETSTLFQTDVNLGGPDDPTTLAYPSGNGDLVLKVTGSGAGNAGVDVSITLGYETIA